MINLRETFEKYDDEHLNFDRVENKLHDRPDICAFLLLDKLLPNAGRDMVCAASHDIIYLEADCQELNEAATEEDILMLLRCGVFYDTETDSLAMFV